MPFILLAIGLMLTVVGVRDNQDAFYGQVQKDFTGPNSFTNWLVPVVALGCLGYVKPIRPAVDLFLALMVVVFFLSNKGGVQNLLPALQKAFNDITPSATVSATVPLGGSATPAPTKPSTADTGSGFGVPQIKALLQKFGIDGAIANAPSDSAATAVADYYSSLLHK